jgi:hypothetical protein
MTGRNVRRSVTQRKSLMAKVAVKALTDHTAFGKTYKPGATYEVEPEYLETLVVQGKAEVAKSGRYRTTDMRAAKPKAARVARKVKTVRKSAKKK